MRLNEVGMLYDRDLDVVELHPISSGVRLRNDCQPDDAWLHLCTSP